MFFKLLRFIFVFCNTINLQWQQDFLGLSCSFSETNQQIVILGGIFIQSLSGDLDLLQAFSSL